ncbi:MAG: 4Fe-4S dicluster domain-containing protein [Spirochaetales bacterium]|nr:4Fe-4S dicluster domain-containing protein [Spirochaetales bacterium]MCF7937345.1 4Fe-4S dicluster domain-containing protein [Spirochaetales bacterium]
MKIDGKSIRLPFVFLGIFLGFGLWRFLATGAAFYLLNFGYLGTAISLGIFLGNILPRRLKPWGRRVSLVMVGSYLLGYVGFRLHENLQIEGFWFYLWMGVFAGAALHYFLAKIAGPFFFGRGWCGWACWTAMFTDLLPWKKPRFGRVRKLGILRYLHFSASLGLVFWVIFGNDGGMAIPRGQSELLWLGAGNAAYYTAAFVAAAVLKDNRAFCKYLCPVTVFLKAGTKLSLLKIAIDKHSCVDCGVCEENCPMDIALTAYKDSGRIGSTECIFCTTCVDLCPARALKPSFGFSPPAREYLMYRDRNGERRVKPGRV